MNEPEFEMVPNGIDQPSCTFMQSIQSISTQWTPPAPRTARTPERILTLSGENLVQPPAPRTARTPERILTLNGENLVQPDPSTHADQPMASDRTIGYENDSGSSDPPNEEFDMEHNIDPT